MIYCWLCWVIVAPWTSLWLWGPGATLELCCLGFSLWWLLIAEHGLQSSGSRSCSVRAQWLPPPASRAQVQQLWHMGLVAPWHVESSQIRDWTYACCIGRWILYHWANQENPSWVLLKAGVLKILLHRSICLHFSLFLMDRFCCFAFRLPALLHFHIISSLSFT